MFKSALTAALLLSSVTGTVLLADDNEMMGATSFQSKKWEVGALLVGILEGNDNDVLDSDFPGIGLRAGYRMTDNWSGVVEILAMLNSDVDDPAIGEVNVVDYIAGVNYDIFPEDDFYTPYVSLGLGYRTISDLDDRDAWNILPGIGIKMMIDDSLQLLIEGKARFNIEDDEKGAIGTIGISYLY